MMSMLPCLLLPLLAAGGEVVLEHSHSYQPQDTLSEVAKAQVEKQLLVRSERAATVSTVTTVTSSSNVTSFNFTVDGITVASLDLGDLVVVELAPTKCMGTVSGGKCTDGKDGPGIIAPDMANMISFPLDGSATASATAKGNTSVLTVAFTDLKWNETALPSLKLTGASLVMVVSLEGVTRNDYWNVSSSTLTLNGSFNGTALPSSSDVTPKSGYTWAEPACTAPYGICAPAGLSWTCGDQVLAPIPTVMSSLKLGSLTAKVHLLDMELRLGNSTEVFNWDCDPLIPLSVWVSVLVTLFLASILLWGLFMLATLQTPTRFDDPKGPSIHVPAAE